MRLSKTEAGHRRDRLELFTRDGGEFEGGENSLLLQVREVEGGVVKSSLQESDEMLSSAGRQLQDGRRLLAETEEVRTEQRRPHWAISHLRPTVTTYWWKL